jgi:predicted MFS family arabinose efflux permease
MSLSWSLCNLLTGFACSFVSLLIPRVLAGASKAAFSNSGLSLVTAAYPKDRHGMVVGIFSISIPLGLALGTLLAGYLAAITNWRVPFFVLAALGAITGIAAFFIRDYQTDSTGIASGLKGFLQSVRELMRIPTLRWMFLGFGMLMITMQAQLAWMPSYLMRVYGWNTAQAGSITGITGLMAVAGAFLGGMAADVWYRKDRRGRLYLPALAAAGSSVCLVAAFFGFAASFPLGMTFGLLFGAISMAAIPSLSSVSQDVVPLAHKGLSYGLTVFSMYFLGGAWSPMMVGAISDTLGGGADGLMWAATCAAGGGLLAAICFLVSAKTYLNDEAQVDGLA